jgi:hypothetical protein
MSEKIEFVRNYRDLGNGSINLTDDTGHHYK